MGYIKKINEFINSVNENSFGIGQVEEGKFEDKLVKICRNIFKYRDDLLSIQEAVENTRNTQLQFDNMSMVSRGSAIYFDYHFYNDKHVVMSIYKQNGHSYLTLSGEFNRNNIRSNATVLFERDLTINESINKVSAMLGFNYHTVDGAEGIWVDLFNKGGIDKVDEIGGDEFLGLFEEFDEELPSFIEYLKTELNTL